MENICLWSAAALKSLHVEQTNALKALLQVNVCLKRSVQECVRRPAGALLNANFITGLRRVTNLG